MLLNRRISPFAVLRRKRIESREKQGLQNYKKGWDVYLGHLCYEEIGIVK